MTFTGTHFYYNEKSAMLPNRSKFGVFATNPDYNIWKSPHFDYYSEETTMSAKGIQPSGSLFFTEQMGESFHLKKNILS